MSQNNPPVPASAPDDSPKDFHPLVGISLIMIAVAAAGYFLMTLTKEDLQNGLPVGSDAPVITAQGWVNGNAPTTEELKGKVVVVDAWATWCIPCRQEAPELAKVYQKYANNPDVVFIGLTTDDATYLPQIENFLKTTGVTWRNGYGAFKTLDEFKADMIPTLWVIDRSGKVALCTHYSETLPRVIDEALTRK
jgi:thiol-disulfide isomerase/thioredoxin